jgi:ubiquitin conjugation factor E4 B
MLEDTVRILKRHEIVPAEQIAALEVASREIVQAGRDAFEAEEALGEVPEEFLDPIMFTLMKDPVCLATTSRVTLDRATITAHLLNDPTDPFNRMPLSITDLIPDQHLLTRIEEWKSLKKKNNNLLASQKQ